MNTDHHMARMSEPEIGRALLWGREDVETQQDPTQTRRDFEENGERRITVDLTPATPVPSPFDVERRRKARLKSEADAARAARKARRTGVYTTTTGDERSQWHARKNAERLALLAAERAARAVESVEVS